MASPAQKYRFSGLSQMTAENIEQLDEMLEDLYGFLTQSPLGAGDEDLNLAELGLDPGFLTVDSDGDIHSEGDTGLMYILSSTPANLAFAATGNALISGGVAAAPTWGKIALTTHVSGILPIANGGTNKDTFTTGSVIYYDGTRFQEDNSGLFFDAANDRLGIGIANPTNALDVRATSPITGLYHSDQAGFAAFRFFEQTTLRSSVQHIGSTFATVGRRDDLELVTLQTTGDIVCRPNDVETARFLVGGGLTLSTPLTVANGGTGLATATAYAVLCGGTTGTGALQSIASVGTSGQVLTSNGAAALPTFQAISAEPTEQTTTSTGTQNDFSLSAAYTYLRCNNASALTLTGFTVSGSAPTAGDRLVIVSVGAGNVFLSHNTGSTAANRLTNMVTSGVTPLAAGKGVAEYQYDDTDDRWKLVYHNQGAFITDTFAAGNFYARDAMTWTVASGDVTADDYFVMGKILVFRFSYFTTTVGGTPSTELKRAIPNSWTCQGRSTYKLTRVDDNGTARDGAWGRVNNGDVELVFFTTSNAATNWNTSTDNTYVEGMAFVSIN